ncbi:XisH family protein [Floridanema aerugineum]|uniref:XisH family protein n=1 Tax=Floridaenema aerugineum BLCC-F46 TaxID=3153654 RepID=A0ABV4WZP9_9CYAN
MPARDIYHDVVKKALIKDDWIITHDPLSLKWGKKDMYVDLGAKQLLAAERAERKIAVEIKSFTGLSEMSDLEKAIGQYVIYHDVLSQVEPDRELYLAVSEEVASGLFEEPIGELLLRNNRVCLVVFNPDMEVIVKWIP